MKRFILNIVRRICGTQKISDELNQLKDLMRAVNHNLLQLGIDSETIYINDGNKVFPLYRDHGKFSFMPHSLRKSDSVLPGIIVVTLPKSGTHLWMKILEECGFVLTEIEGCATHIADLRGVSFDGYYQSNITPINMPLYLQIQCLKNGDILPGHIDFSCAEYVQGHPFLISKRDFRTTAVSYLRHCQCYKNLYSETPWYSLGATEEALFHFLHSEVFAGHMHMCREIIKWDQAFPDHVVRYEDVQQPGSAEYAGVVEKLSRITGLDADSVSAAIERARGTRTFTYSGKKSSLDGIWSDRVEARFQELQGHILNEQLGYSRDWRPA